MLVYYILSGGKHPFDSGLDIECELNIYKGKYSLDYIEDLVAKDLIELMISDEPEKRPNVEDCLNHPFFWSKHKRVEYLKDIGNHKEIAKCRDAKDELLSAVEEYVVEGSLQNWKTKFPEALVQKMDSFGLPYPENTVGLLRFIRNLYSHYPEEATQVDLMMLFPDLFGSIYKFAKKWEWNSKL